MGEVSEPGLSYCSIPDSHDAVEPVTVGVYSHASQSVYTVSFLRSHVTIL